MYDPEKVWMKWSTHDVDERERRETKVERHAPLVGREAGSPLAKSDDESVELGPKPNKADRLQDGQFKVHVKSWSDSVAGLGSIGVGHQRRQQSPDQEPNRRSSGPTTTQPTHPTRYLSVTGFDKPELEPIKVWVEVSGKFVW